MPKYKCSDGNVQVEIEADSHGEACQEFLDGGDWGDRSKTVWIDVRSTLLDEDGADTDDTERHTITLEPTAPECSEGQGAEHVWASPYSVVGGCKENPGVYGNGGGVIITEFCRCCGRYQVTNTWAQRSDTGKEGLTSVEYRDSDEASETWLVRRQEHWEKWVRDNSDEDVHNDSDLDSAFIAIFRRECDDEDRAKGLWSLLCQAVGCDQEVESE